MHVWISSSLLFNFFQSCFTQDWKIIVVFYRDNKFSITDEPYFWFLIIQFVLNKNECSFILVSAKLDGLSTHKHLYGWRAHRPTILFRSTMLSLLSLLLLVKVTLSNSFMMSFLGMTGYSPWKFLSPPLAHLTRQNSCCCFSSRLGSLCN